MTTKDSLIRDFHRIKRKVKTASDAMLFSAGYLSAVITWT
jgi:hypothetical protein